MTKYIGSLMAQADFAAGVKPLATSLQLQGIKRNAVPSPAVNKPPRAVV